MRTRQRRFLALSIFTLAGACGKGKSNSIVSAAGSQPSDTYINIFESLNAVESSLDLRVQLRKTDENGDILALDGSDTLTLVGGGELTSTESAAAGGPTGFQYHVLLKGQPNAARDLQWRRGGEPLASTEIAALSTMSFVSYEYCHSVTPTNYAQIRYVGPAPASDEEVCGTVGYDCVNHTCQTGMTSCNVYDFRIRFDDSDDQLQAIGTTRLGLTRTTVTQVPNYKNSLYTRIYDAGFNEVSNADFCTKILFTEPESSTLSGSPASPYLPR